MRHLNLSNTRGVYMRKFLFFLAFILSGQLLFSEIYIKCSDEFNSHTIHEHTHYTLCYVEETKCPEWVYWKLTAKEADAAESVNNRTNDFKKCGESASPSDYKNSGYDKGHMCPNNDFDFTRQDASDTFRMCNMCPQTHLMNAGKWKDLESYTHTLAKNYDYVEIVAGPIFSGETKKLASGVRVPDAFYRIFYNKEANLLECYIVDQLDFEKKVDLAEIEEKTGLKFELV